MPAHDETTPMPTLIFEPAPCPRCGARTEIEAADRCRPQEDWTGEKTCPSEDTDLAGNLLQPTAASLAALDAWYDEQGRKEDRHVARR